MKIGELVQRTGLSHATIRFYERNGLLKDVQRPYPQNNYKEYGEENLKRLTIVKCLKKFGFTLSECGEVLARMDKSPTGRVDRKEVLGSKLAQINEQIDQLVKTRDTLLIIVES